LDEAAIVSTALEGILYGVYFAQVGSCRPPSKRDVGFSLLMFIGTIWVLTREERHHASTRMMISVAVVFLVLSTTVSSFVDVQDRIHFLITLFSPSSIWSSISCAPTKAW